jgi:hypothetical protein
MYHVWARGIESFAGPKDVNTLNITGYWPKKLVNYQSVYDDGFQEIGYPFTNYTLAGFVPFICRGINEVNGPTGEVLYLYR